MFLIGAIHLVSFAQTRHHFGTRDYFITAGYGFGTSYWSSTIKNTELYDKKGRIIKSGDLKFKSNTDVRCYDINALFPISKILLGVGLNFEENTMDQIDISAPSSDAGIVLYDQKFRMDKIYALVEFPLYRKEKSDFLVMAQARFGYYNYSGVDRINFFGEAAFANTYFVGVGLIGAYNVIPHIYLYVHPNFEYKYFSNNSSEKPIDIRHNIYTFVATVGLKIDVSGF